MSLFDFVVLIVALVAAWILLVAFLQEQDEETAYVRKASRGIVYTIPVV
jgi:hypothetical protein